MTRSNPLIAIVDDEPAVSRALGRLLRAAGFDIALYCSGEAFLQSLAVTPPDCVVLDLFMPGVDGLQVQREMAGLHPGTPVLFITAHDTSKSRRLALAGGATAYLTKPVDAEALIEAVSRSLTTPP